MPDEEWIKTLEDGRKMKFIYQELPEDAAFMSAQLAGNEVVYSVVLTKAGNPLSRSGVSGSRYSERKLLIAQWYARTGQAKSLHPAHEPWHRS